MIPHLLFAHMLADYMLQTNWLVVRKAQAWDGLALHGFMVWMMSILVIPGSLATLILPITGMALIHTGQDWVKVRSGKWLQRRGIHGFYSYMADQISHYVTIILMQIIFGALLNPVPGHTEQAIMAIGACVMAITRFYEVTWWANFLKMKMMPYFDRWRVFEYAEHLAIFAVSAVGLFYIAPLFVLPRLVVSRYSLHPVWKQQYGLLEMGLGVVFSMALGMLVWRIYFS